MIAAALGACSAGRVEVGRAADPALADPEVVRLVALGDTGKGNAGQWRVAEAARETCEALGCDLVVLLGDNLYPRGMEAPDDPRAEAWIAEPYTPIAPVYAVLGNHDWNDRDEGRARWQIDWATEREAVELPANAWWMSAGPATFAALDTNAATHFGSGFQADWLTETLDAASTPWKVVLGHHPYRSDGPHGNAGRYEGLGFVPIASGKQLRKLFDRALCGHADLYLAGHDHSRQLLEACGTDLVVSGAGATATKLVDRGNDPRFARATTGFAWIELGPSAGEVRFYDERGALEGTFALDPSRVR